MDHHQPEPIDLWMVAILPGALTGYVTGLITRRSRGNLTEARTVRQQLGMLSILSAIIILQTVLAIAMASQRDFEQQMKRIRSATQSDDAMLKNMIARVNLDSKKTTPVTPQTPDKLADSKSRQAEKKSNDSSLKAHNEHSPPKLDSANDQQTKRLITNEQPTSYAGMLADLTMKRLARHPGEWISAGSSPSPAACGQFSPRYRSSREAIRFPPSCQLPANLR